MNERRRTIFLVFVSLLLAGTVERAFGAPGSPELSPANGWSPLAQLSPGPPPAGDDRLPNCPLQREPAAVTRPDGGVVVVWWDKFKGDINQLVWTQRTAGATTWTKPQVVHPDAIAYWQRNTVKLVAMPDGSVLALWEKNQLLREPTELLMSTLAAGAHEWSAPQKAPPDWNFSIQFASGADGSLHAVWTGRQGDGHGATPYYSRRKGDGTWERPIALRTRPSHAVWVIYYGGPSRNDYTGGVAPNIAVRPDGAMLVAWLDNEDTLTREGTSGYDIRYRIWEPVARAWSDERGIESDGDRGTTKRDRGLIGLHQGAALLTAATPDAFHLVYVDANGVLQWTSMPAGARDWARPQPVFHGKWKAFDPTLHVGKAGALFLTARGFANMKDTLLAAELPAKAPAWRTILQAPVEFFDHAAGLTASGAPFILIENSSRVQGCLTLDITEHGPLDGATPVGTASLAIAPTQGISADQARPRTRTEVPQVQTPPAEVKRAQKTYEERRAEAIAELRRLERLREARRDEERAEERRRERQRAEARAEEERRQRGTSRTEPVDVGALSQVLATYMAIEEIGGRCRRELPAQYGTNATYGMAGMIRSTLEESILRGVDPDYQNGIKVWARTFADSRMRNGLKAVGGDLGKLCAGTISIAELEFKRIQTGEIHQKVEVAKQPPARSRADEDNNRLQKQVSTLVDEARRQGAKPFASAREVVTAINDYGKAASGAPDQSRAQLAATLCARLEATEVRNWTGQVIRLSGEPGKLDFATLTVRVDRDLALWTIESRRQDLAGENRVMRGTPAFAAINGLKLEDTIRVSGRFVAACDVRRFAGSGAGFDFGFKFTEVAKQ